VALRAHLTMGLLFRSACATALIVHYTLKPPIRYIVLFTDGGKNGLKCVGRWHPMLQYLWLGLAVRFFQSRPYSTKCLEGEFSEVPDTIPEIQSVLRESAYILDKARQYVYGDDHHATSAPRRQRSMVSAGEERHRA
jgi:hypothetical protein